MDLRNTLIAGNFDLSPFPTPRAPDCAGTMQSAGHNLIGSLGFILTACHIEGDTTGNLIGQDPLLEVLADNGGPTDTHALLFSSPAIDAGNPAGCVEPDGSPLTMDQRYGLRPNRCDIGAFEVGAELWLIFSDGFESGDVSAW